MLGSKRKSWGLAGLSVLHRNPPLRRKRPRRRRPNPNQAAMRLHRRRQTVPRSRPATRRFLSGDRATGPAETLLENVSRRVDEAIEEMVAVEAETVALPTAEPTSSQAPPLPEGKPAEPPAALDLESAPPVPAAPPEPEMSPIEAEFRALIQELMDAGVEPGDMMDDPRWEDLNERAVAAELNAWALFVEMTGQQG